MIVERTERSNKTVGEYTKGHNKQVLMVRKDFKPSAALFF